MPDGGHAAEPPSLRETPSRVTRYPLTKVPGTIQWRGELKTPKVVSPENGGAEEKRVQQFHWLYLQEKRRALPKILKGGL